MSSPQTRVQAALKRRVRAFYAHLNARAFDKCFRFLDPRVFAQPGSVTLIQYETTLAAFMAHVGEVRVKEVVITGLHVGQPNKLYEGRDFAIGKTAWEDANGSVHQFAERWVCDDGVWYTRATGMTLPAEPALTVPSSQATTLRKQTAPATAAQSAAPDGAVTSRKGRR